MNVADFNWFDWVLVAIVIFSMVMAFRRGFVRALFGMLGFIGGFLLAAQYYTVVGDWFNGSRLVVAPSTARVIGFLLIVRGGRGGVATIGAADTEGAEGDRADLSRSRPRDGVWVCPGLPDRYRPADDFDDVQAAVADGNHIGFESLFICCRA